MSESKWDIQLSTTEKNKIVELNLRQNNQNSEIVRVQLIKKMIPYDLTALKVFFVTHFNGKDNLKIPIQKAATIIDAKEGIFEFVFDQDCMQRPGRQEAYFEIYDFDKYLDTTQNFTYEIVSSSRQMKADFTPWIGTWVAAEEMLDEGTAKVLNDKTEKLELEKANVVDVDEQLRQQRQDTDNKLEKKTDNLLFVAMTEDLQRQIESTQAGMIGSYNSEEELKLAHPNGAKGYAIVWLIESGDKKPYMYTYKNGGWVKGGPANPNVLPDNSIQTVKYQNKSITAGKTNFMIDSDNLFNRDMLVENHMWLNDARTGTPNTNYSYLPEINIKSGQSICLNDSNNNLIPIRYVAAFDSVGSLLKNSGGQNFNGVYTAGSGVYKIVISILNNYVPRQLMLSYGTTPKKFKPFEINFDNNVVLSEKMKEDITNNLITPKYLLESLEGFVNQIDKASKIESKYISGYNVDGSPGPDMLNSNDTDIYKIKYPDVEKGKIRIFFKNVGKGQQVFLTDENDKYITMSNVNNFPTWNRKGWTIKPLENYFEIDLEDVSKEERYVYVCIFKRDSEMMYAGIDGKTYLNQLLFSTEETDTEILLPDFYPVVANNDAYIYFDQALHSEKVKSCYLNTPMWSNKNNSGTFNTSIKTDQNEIREVSAQLNNKTIKNITNIISVPENAGSNQTKKVLIVGESTTDTEKSIDYIPEVRKRFENDGMKVELVGTRGIGLDKHEGRSGWGVGALRFLESRGSVQNPFYNPVKKDFDFGYYLLQNPDAANLDYFILRFGINDPNRFVEELTTSSFVDHYNFIRNDVLKHNSKVKFIFEVTMSMARTPKSITHGSRREIMKRNKKILETYQGREPEGIYVSSAYLNVDPINDYPTREVPINIYSDKQELEVIDATHPAKSGQQKQADVTYWMLKYIAWKEEIQ